VGLAAGARADAAQTRHRLLRHPAVAALAVLAAGISIAVVSAPTPAQGASTAAGVALSVFFAVLMFMIARRRRRLQPAAEQGTSPAAASDGAVLDQPPQISVDDLLVLNVGMPEAMERLCKFLNIPYNGEKMPALNQSA